MFPGNFSPNCTVPKCLKNKLPALDSRSWNQHLLKVMLNQFSFLPLSDRYFAATPAPSLLLGLLSPSCLGNIASSLEFQEPQMLLCDRSLTTAYQYTVTCNSLNELRCSNTRDWDPSCISGAHQLCRASDYRARQETAGYMLQQTALQ